MRVGQLVTLDASQDTDQYSLEGCVGEVVICARLICVIKIPKEMVSVVGCSLVNFRNTSLKEISL